MMKNIWGKPPISVIIISMVSCQKGPTRHANAQQIGPFWQDTLDIRTASVIFHGYDCFKIQSNYNAVQYIIMITYSFEMTTIEHKSDFELTKQTAYLALTGELWGVYCEIHKSDFKLTKHTLYLALTGELRGVYCVEFGEKWPCYSSISLASWTLMRTYSALHLCGKLTS